MGPESKTVVTAVGEGIEASNREVSGTPECLFPDVLIIIVCSVCEKWM